MEGRMSASFHLSLNPIGIIKTSLNLFIINGIKNQESNENK
jgi:hypothetical protein